MIAEFPAGATDKLDYYQHATKLGAGSEARLGFVEAALSSGQGHEADTLTAACRSDLMKCTTILGSLAILHLLAPVSITALVKNFTLPCECRIVAHIIPLNLHHSTSKHSLLCKSDCPVWHLQTWFRLHKILYVF